MKLISKISVLKNRVLLRKWFNFYQDLGVDEFLILIHATKEEDPFIDSFEYFLKSYPILSIKRDYGDEVWSVEKEAIYLTEFRKEFIGSSEWYFNADSDEFIRTSHTQIEEIKNSSHDYVLGRFCDRFNSEGKFPPLSLDIDIFEQFSLETRFTEKIAKGWHQKVPLVRGSNIEITTGFHAVIDPTGLTVYPIILEVDHFKWSADLWNAIEHMFKTHGIETRAGKRIEMLNTLFFFLKNSRIVVDIDELHKLR